MSPCPEARPFTVSRGQAYYVFALLFLLYVFDFVDRFLVASLFPHLKADWGLSDTQCGLLMSVVFWSVLIFTLPASVMVDRWSRKKSIGLMGIIWSLATGACALTRNFTQLFTVRALVGVGEAGYVPGGYAMLSAYFPENKRATVNGLFNAAVPLGAAIGIACGGIIAVKWGWRHVFGIMALPGLVLALLMFRVKDYRTIRLVKKPGPLNREAALELAELRDVVRGLLKTPSLLGTYMGYAGNMFVTSALMAWLPTFYNRTEGLAMDKAGIKASAIMLLAIIGAPLGGLITDRLRRRRLDARMIFPAASSLLTGLAVFAAFFLLRGKAQYGALLVSGLAAPLFVAGAASVTQDVVHPGLRAMSFSLCSIIQNLLGSSLGPIFVGWVSDRYGLETALVLIPIFNLLAAGSFFFGARHYQKDLERVEPVSLVED
ncbi:MAG: MFS transporter [Proteobacteria bacterium]|nr:MFS transporter [Pseudomonadota bacterium]